MEKGTFGGNHYYERIGYIQQSLHGMEKRRLELERELFAHSLSDKRISQIKCAKLRSYLKELSEREKRAKMRNLELLRDVKCIEMSLNEYGPDRGSLRQQKAEHLDRISRFMAVRKKEVHTSNVQELNETKVDAANTKHQQAFHTLQDLQRVPSGTPIGHQSSGGSNAEAAPTSAPSHQAARRSSSRRQPSPECLPSGLSKAFSVCGEAARADRTHLSDGISGLNSSPVDRILSDKHERATSVLQSSQALTSAAGCLSSGGDDERQPSPPVTLTRPQKNILFASIVSPMCSKNTPAELVVHQSPIMENKSVTHPVSDACFVEESQESPGKCENVSTSSSSRLSMSSDSDLSISLTESETEEDSDEGVSHLEGSPTVSRAATNASPGGSEVQSVQSQPSSRNRSLSVADSGPTEQTPQRLSREGLFHLLESIEGQLEVEPKNVYSGSLIDKGKLNTIISLCNSRAALNEEDLEACGAVVLHELQTLSWSTEKGCLLPQDLVKALRCSTQPEDIRSSLPPDAARLWNRWFKHALLIKERRVIGTDRLLQLFTPLLLQRHATYGHQAKVLLRTILSRSSEECPSAREKSDSSSSRGLPSPLNEDEEGSARSAHDPQEQEQSGEEDSRDESPAESIPIRESKAYQLLKQSAAQEWLQSSGEEGVEKENGLTGINGGCEEDPGWAKHPSHQDPYPWKKKTHTKYEPPKAFWGMSDDSNSEIEAALRPQPFNTNDDDSDDFFE